MANRPLHASYPLVFFDAIWVKVKDDGFVHNTAVYIASHNSQNC